MIRAFIATLLALAAADQHTESPVKCLGSHVCTAKDVKVSLFHVSPDICFEGHQTEFLVTVKFVLSAGTRYDMGFWANVLGGTTVLNNAVQCAATMFTPLPPPDFGFTDVDHDVCGDQTKDGTILVNYTLNILCHSATDKLPLPGCATWNQNPGPVCVNASQAKPGSPSKCSCFTNTNTNVTVIKPTKSPTHSPTTKSPTTRTPTLSPTPRGVEAACTRDLIAPCPLFPTDATAFKVTANSDLDPNQTAFSGPFALRAFRLEQPGDCIQFGAFDWEGTFFGDILDTCVPAAFPTGCFLDDRWFTLDRVAPNKYQFNFHGWASAGQPDGIVEFNGASAGLISICAGNGALVITSGGNTAATLTVTFPFYVDMAIQNPPSTYVFPFHLISSTFTHPNKVILADKSQVDCTQPTAEVGVLRYPGDCIILDPTQLNNGQTLAIGTFIGGPGDSKAVCANYKDQKALIIQIVSGQTKATWCPGFKLPDSNAFPGQEGVCTYDTPSPLTAILPLLTKISICKTACGLQSSLFAQGCNPALRTDIIEDGDFVLDIASSTNLCPVYTAPQNITFSCTEDPLPALRLAALKPTTRRPTARPTKAPTFRPTTRRPTARPTKAPTVRPTTKTPTLRPSTLGRRLLTEAEPGLFAR